MTKILLVGLGGFVGALSRYGLSGIVHRQVGGSFPYGTLVVNVLGCLAVGGFLHLVEDRSMLGPGARVFLSIGLLGGFTTFSSFGYETVELLRAREAGLAVLNVAGNLVLGLSAVWLGRAILRGFGL
jgi:CrcB protein